MAHNRRIRMTYGGKSVPRRPLYPGLLRHKSGGGGKAIPLLVSRILLAVLVLAVLASMVVSTSAYSAYTQITASLTPRLDAIDNHKVLQTSRIYDRNGRLLYEFFDTEKRTKVELEDVSPLLINATIAIEDKTFFSNSGVDYEGILRTLYSSLSEGEETGGASTITQQIIKGVILDEEERRYENRYQRKFKEIILAQELNERLSKEDVLELYLNEIYYGNLAYGIEAASEVYFGISANDLSLAQAALLAGLPQLPSQYDPMNYLSRSEDNERSGFLPGVRLGKDWTEPSYALPAELSPPKWRQIAVFRQMVDEGYVDADQARAAIAQDLDFVPQEVPLNAPHFVFYVRSLLEEQYGQQLFEDGLEIHTTLDLELHNMVQQKAAERIKELEERNINNAAVVVMQPNTGQILAMVGSIDYDAVVPTSTPGEEGNVLDGQVNVTTRERQPGSALKPFTYLAAMEQGMTPASIMWDVPTEFPIGNGDWYGPENYNKKWYGPVRIRTALANSLNMPAVKALKFAGIDHTLGLLDRVGIKTGLKRGSGHYGLALTLGGGEVTTLELTTAYNTLASNGRYIPPTPILKVTDSSGRVVEEYQTPEGAQVVDPGLVNIIADMMSDDEARRALWGRNSDLNLSRPSAVKTGTSNDWRDAWTLGFTPYATVGVWSGNNNNEPTARVESLEGGGVIWHNVMEEIFTWMDTRPEYEALFSAPFPDGSMPTEFAQAANTTLQEKSICELPGPFGGYSKELFTGDMIAADERAAASQSQETLQIQGRIGGRCDFYRKITVVKTGAESGTRYCLPQSGVKYPSSMLTTVSSWRVPPEDPNERIKYVWSTGSAGAVNYPRCSGGLLASPTETPEPTAPSEAQPEELAAPVAGSIRMPALTGLGENQAKEVLQRLGVSSIYVDYQTRSRIPDIFDQFVPYAVISTQPSAGNWILPGTTVVLGVRSPEAEAPPAQPREAPPEPAPPEAPPAEPPPPEPAQPPPADPAPQPPAEPPPPEPAQPQPLPIAPQPPATPMPLPELQRPGG